MKAIKLILSVLFLFPTAKGFCQNPIIQNTNICTTTGSMASFTVDYPTASTYEWQVKTLNVDWTPITSSNASSVYSDYDSSTLNITKSEILPVTGTLYRVIVYDGSNNLTSNVATLTVDSKPVSKLITGASPVCEGGSKELTYGAASVGDIQWQSSTTGNLDEFYDIEGAELIYTATDLQDTTWFRVMNSSSTCSPAYSPAVQVIVNPLPVAGYIDGGYINVCKSSNSTLLTLYDYAGTIEWQKALEVADSPGTPSTFAKITSATSPEYIATNLTATTYFRAVLSSGVCTSVITNPVVIIVVPKPVSTLISVASPVICAGGSKTLTYGTGSVGEIQWQSSTTGLSDEFYDIEGAELIYTATDLQETTWFRVKNTSGEEESCGYPDSYSPAVKVVVDPLAVAGNIDRQGDDIRVCISSNSTKLILYNYEGAIQWQKALDVEGSPGTPGKFENITLANREFYTASLSQVESAKLKEPTTYYYRALVSSGVCPSVTTFDSDNKITLYNQVVAIIVDPKPVSKSISGATPACIGGSKVLVYGIGSVGDIQWQSSPTGNLDEFYDIDGNTELIYTANDLQETTWFRVMNTSGEACDPASSYSPPVQVVVDTSNAGKIEGGNSIVSKKSDETELTLKDYTGAIQWQKAASLTDEFTNIPLSTSSTYITTGLTETTYFRTLVSNGDCSAVASDPVVVNVDSEFKALAFPNPFDSEFNINLTPQSTDPIELKIYDMLGRQIENHYVKPSEINSIRMGTTYPPGFFTVLIKQGQQEVNLKVIKK